MSFGTPTSLGVSNNSPGATLTLTGVSAPAGALICVAVVEATTSGAGSCADSVNGAYTLPSNGYRAFSGATDTINFFYFSNSAALSSATITYTKKGSGNATALAAWYVTGAGALDLTTTPTVNTSSTPSITSGTPAVSGEMFFGIVGWSTSTRTFTQASGWSTPPNASSINSSLLEGGYLLNSGSGAETYAPTLSGNSQWAALLFSFEPGGNSYSVSAIEGVYSLTGEPQALSSARHVSAVEGVYSLTGEPQTLNSVRHMPAIEGVYSLTGEPQTLVMAHRVPAVEGVYSLTGEPQTLNSVRHMPAIEGVYSLTGEPQALSSARHVSAVEGVYSLTGEPQTLNSVRHMPAIEGVYSLTGEPQILSRPSHFTIAAGEGIYAVNGRSFDALLVRAAQLVPPPPPRVFSTGAQGGGFAVPVSAPQGVGRGVVEKPRLQGVGRVKPSTNTYQGKGLPKK